MLAAQIILILLFLIVFFGLGLHWLAMLIIGVYIGVQVVPVIMSVVFYLFVGYVGYQVLKIIETYFKREKKNI